MSQFSAIADVFRYLDNIPKFRDSGKDAARFELEPMFYFCGLMGNPQNQFRSIHIAGTNGKGTTAHLFAETYRRLGFKAGLYTSPHLLEYNERISVNGEHISDAALLSFFQAFEEELAAHPLSYFELSTAIAFWHFSVEKVDVAVLETGLGGRLDATNVVIPELSVITSVSIDHEDVLGKGIERIAGEKAGIIKAGVPLVLGNVHAAAKEVILDAARKKGSKVLQAASISMHQSPENEWMFQEGDVLYSLGNRFVETIHRYNLGAVWLGVQALKPVFDVQKEQLADALSKIEPLIGRFERLAPNWYFSGAHNQEAMESLLEGIHKLGAKKKPILVISCMKDKLSDYITLFSEHFRKIYSYTLPFPRAASPNEIKRFIPGALHVNDAEIVNLLKELQEELVIFTGSFYFYPTIKNWTGQINSKLNASLRLPTSD